MLEYAKVVRVIRISLLRNQRHWTHMLYWNMQTLSNQDISPKKSEAVDSHAMMEHTKVVWVIRTSFLKNQRHWTHMLCWNMERLFEWSEYPSWEIRGTGLTCYSRTCKGFLNVQNIFYEKSEALDSHAMLEHAKVVCVIRTSPEKSEALNSPAILEYAKIFWVISTSHLRNWRHWTYSLYWNMQRFLEWSKHLLWKIKDTGLTTYVGTCKNCLSDQNTSSKKSETLDSHSMLEHVKIVGVIRIFLLRDQRHWTHKLCWNVQRLFEWSGHLS